MKRILLVFVLLAAAALVYGQVSWQNATVSPNPVQVTYNAVINALGYVPPTNSNWVASGTTNSTLSGSATANNFLITPTTLTPSTTNAVVDFSAAGMRTLTLTTNANFTSSNLAAGLSAVVKMTNSTASTLLLTFPAWIPLGSAQPTQILPNKVGVLGVTAWGTTDAEVTMTYAVQP